MQHYDNTQNDANMEKETIIIKQFDGIWTRSQVEADSGNLYVFTDNTDRDSGKRVIEKDSPYYKKYGDGTRDLHYPTVTAAVIRGLPNALPVSTQRWYHNGAKGVSGRWQDSDIDEFKSVLRDEFFSIRKEIIARVDPANPDAIKQITVFLPGGNDGLAGGQISAITPERTPALYEFLKDQEAALQDLPALFQAIFVDNALVGNQLREAALDATSLAADYEGSEFSPADVNYYADMSEHELRTILVHSLSLLSPEQRRKFMSNLNIVVPAKQEEKAPAEEKNVNDAPAQDSKDLSALARYTPYQLSVILDDVRFPARGESQVFDNAADFIVEKLAAGWNRDMNSAQEKAYLLSVVNALPGEVVDVIVDYAKAQMPIREQNAIASGSVFDENPCDVYTLGFSTKTFDEFRVALPSSTKVVIDTRPKPKNRFRPWFDSKTLEETLSKQGIQYVHIPDTDSEYVSKIHQMILSNEGGVVVCSSESQAAKSSRGLDLGPRLEASGIKVGHIGQGFDSESKRWTSKLRIQTQEELTNYLLGNMELKNGSYKQVRFDVSTGKPIFDEGVSLQKKLTRQAQNRDNYGRDNYNNPVEVAQTENPGMGEAYFEAAKQAHYTLVFKSGHPGPQEKLAMDAAAGRVSAINVPDDDDKLRDPAFARTVVFGENGRGGIYDLMSRQVLKQSMQFPDKFDASQLTLQIEGLNEAKLLNKPVIDGHVTDEELQSAGLGDSYAKIGGYDDGLRVVRPSHASLESFQIFVKNVIKTINEPQTKNVLGEEETERTHFQFTKIISSGESGAGEAGLLAAQELTLKAKAQAPKDFRFTIDDGTLKGRSVSDEASFRNRFKLGLKKGLSDDELRLQIDHVHEAGQNISGPGLTDRQILVLSELGYPNSDILLIQQQCLINNIRIEEIPVTIDGGKILMTGHAGLASLVEQCIEGYGTAAFSSDANEPLTPSRIMAAEDAVDKMLVNYRRNGIGVVTIANPYYPEQFRSFSGYQAERTTQEYTESAGVASAENVTRLVKEERPAILTFKGNIDALSLDKVTVTGNTKPQAFERRAAENIGREIAREDFAIVTAFRPAPAKKHSNPFINASETILGKDIDNVRSRPGKLYEVYSPADDSPYFAASAAMENGGVHIAVSPNTLTSGQDQDRIRRIVENRGVVFSEAGFGMGEWDERLVERSGRLACALGGKALVVGSVPMQFANSPAAEAANAALGIIAVDYGVPAHSETSLEGTDVLLSAGAESISSSAKELPSLISTLRTHSFELDSEKVAENELEVARQMQTKEVMHVDHYAFSVARKGTEQVFIVPANYPDVRQSVINAYGEDVVFADDLSLAKRALGEQIVVVAGESIRSFDGYTGTQLQEEPVYDIPLVYNQGEIYSIINAPRNTPGLIRSQKTRIQNKKDFETFRKLAVQIESKFLDRVYLDSAGEHKPIHFENAFYPVITQHSVEIFQGNELRAKVYLDRMGALKVVSFGSLRDDLTEYSYSKYIFPNDFDSERSIRSRKGESNEPLMIELAARMESILLSVPMEETEMFALATREQREDIAQRLENQFLKLSEDNLGVADADIAKGVTDGLLAEFTKEEFSKTDAVAAIIGEQENVRKKVAQIMKMDRTMDKRIQDAVAKRDAAYNQGYSVEEYEKMDQDIESLMSEKSNILSSLSSAKHHYAVLQNLKEELAVTDKVFIAKQAAERGDKKLTLYVDGAAVEITTSLATKKNQEKAVAVIKDISDAKAVRDKCFHEGIESIENHTADLKQMGKIYDQRHDSEGVKASKSEIKPESFRNGRYIIVRDGKEAYVDENMNIRSDFYASLKPWGGNFGLAKREDGKSNFIAPDGQPIVEKWFDNRSDPSENTFVIEVDDEYGIIGEEGKLFGGRLFYNAHTSIDGWSAVAGGISDGENAGKFNYVNAEGKMLLKKWVDECSDFDNGKAIVKIDGKFNEIDVNGKTLRKNIEVDIPSGQSLFNSGKGKGGRR